MSGVGQFETKNRSASLLNADHPPPPGGVSSVSNKRTSPCTDYVPLRMCDGAVLRRKTRGHPTVH